MDFACSRTLHGLGWSDRIACRSADSSCDEIASAGWPRGLGQLKDQDLKG